jgi:hypothetical protein
MASAEVALFVGALSFAVRSVGGVDFWVRSFRRRVFFGSILSEVCLCGSVRWGRRLLRFDPFGGVPLRFGPLGGVSFAVGSFRRRAFAVRSVGGVFTANTR